MEGAKIDVERFNKLQDELMRNESDELVASVIRRLDLKKMPSVAQLQKDFYVIKEKINFDLFVPENVSNILTIIFLGYEELLYWKI